MKFMFFIAACLLQVLAGSLMAQSPTVTINQAAGQPDPASTQPVNYTVTFSADVTGFTVSDLTFGGPATSGPLTAVITGGPKQYNVAVSGLTPGNLIAYLPAGAATSVVGGFPSLVATSTDNTITYGVATITCPGNITVSASNLNCSAIVGDIGPLVSPSGPAVSHKIELNGNIESGSGSVSGKAFGVGVNNITYYLTDYPDIKCSFQVVVKDTTRPVISCPPTLTVSCPRDVPYSTLPTATDNCTPSNSIEVVFMGETRINEICIGQYTLVRTYRATDASGNSAMCTQKIVVHDNKPPNFLQPPPLSPLNFQCASQVPDPASYNFTAYDDCYPDEADWHVIFKQVKTLGSCPGSFTLTRTWTVSDACQNSTTYTQVINVQDNLAPEFNEGHPSTGITVNCVSEIPPVPPTTAKDNCSYDPVPVIFTEVKSDSVCANRFKLTRTWTAKDSCGNSVSRTQVIFVNDRQPPIFDGLAPSSITVSCEQDIPPPTSQTATDNCGGNPVITYTETKSEVQCINRFKLTRTWTARDSCGNTATRTQVINVNDTEAPKVSGISASKAALWPPNHKMQDVYINYTATDNCKVVGTLSVTSSDPVLGGSDGDQAPDWEIIDGHHIRLRAEKGAHGESRIYTIKVSVSDGCNPPVDSTITVVVAHNITAPHSGLPFKVGSTVAFNGVFWDKPGNTHTAKWLVDGSAAANGVVTEPSGSQNGKVTGSYKFNAPGVYKLQMNVTDQTGVTSWANTNNDMDAIVVIYDPNGGNAFGGGWFTSPAGALKADASATGKASYGFAVNYANPAKPKGETQFEFKVGNFEFNALNFDYLAIGGAKAQFRGTGKIIGAQSGI